MIGIINYNVGNLQNLQNSLDFVGIKSKLIQSPEEMTQVNKIILPGVGAFAHAAENLKKFGFWEPLKERVAQSTPLLGICVGMQLLFSLSHEDGKTPGLDLISGEVKRFETKLKVPQIGWNKVNFKDKTNPLLIGIKNQSWFYFVHSYACFPLSPELQLGTTSYDLDFCSIVNQGKLWGVQFHPEKSQDDGLKLLKNFAENC